MRRIKIMQIISIMLFVIYVVLLVIDLKWGIWGDYSKLIFSFVLAVVAMSLIWKGKLLKSTSTLWFGFSLILCAIAIMIFELINYNIDKYYYLFVLIPIISSLVILAIFANLIYIKVIIFNISIAIPIILYNVLWLTWWWALIIGVVSIAIGVVVSRSISIGKEKV